MNQKLRPIAAIVILLITALAHYSIYSQQDAAASITPDTTDLDLPKDIGAFQQFGPNVEISDKVREQLQTSAILMRNYAAPNAPIVQLTIVHAGTTRRSLHHPQICLVGQGWEIREQYPDPVGFHFDATRMVLFKGAHQDAVLYWLKTGDDFTGSSFVNAWNWATQQLFLKTPTSTMIKISTPIGKQGQEVAFRTLEDFALLLAPIIREQIN